MDALNLTPATIRCRIADGNAPALPELALELVKARAAGAPYDTIGYLIWHFQAAGGAEALSESEIETWLDAALPILADRDTSQALDVWREFAVWLLVDPTAGVARFCEPNSAHLEAVERVASLFRRELDGETVSAADWQAAERASASWASASWAWAWGAGVGGDGGARGIGGEGEGGDEENPSHQTRRIAHGWRRLR